MEVSAKRIAKPLIFDSAGVFLGWLKRADSQRNFISMKKGPTLNHLQALVSVKIAINASINNLCIINKQRQKTCSVVAIQMVSWLRPSITFPPLLASVTHSAT